MIAWIKRLYLWLRPRCLRMVLGLPGKTSARKDAAELCSVCGIYVGPGASADTWRRVLRSRVPDVRLRRAVCGVLAEHKRHICRAGPAVRSKIWFVVDDFRAFGSGLARLRYFAPLGFRFISSLSPQQLFWLLIRT